MASVQDFWQSDDLWMDSDLSILFGSEQNNPLWREPQSSTQNEPVIAFDLSPTWAPQPSFGQVEHLEPTNSTRPSNNQSQPKPPFLQKQKAAKIDPSLWDTLLPQIQILFASSKLNEVLHILAKDYGFHPSKTQLRKKITQWQDEGKLPTKNFKKADMDYMVLMAQHRQQANAVATEFFYHGFPVPPDKLDAHRKRFGLNTSREFDHEAPPRFITWQTPAANMPLRTSHCEIRSNDAASTKLPSAPSNAGSPMTPAVSEMDEDVPTLDRPTNIQGAASTLVASNNEGQPIASLRKRNFGKPRLSRTLLQSSHASLEPEQAVQHPIKVHTSTSIPRASLRAFTNLEEGSADDFANSSLHTPLSEGTPLDSSSEHTDQKYPGLLLQPDFRPISYEQLAAEVKGIYAGLVMVESKCIAVDKAQMLAVNEGKATITREHWQALIALHRTLLHEHHDFLLASEHPSGTPALKKLTAKYNMIARMWKHGVHSFLELLRHCLPESRDFMLCFIQLSYNLLALLYETVPAYRTVFVECLGDVARYRMAIEDEDIQDRDIWAATAQHWYATNTLMSPGCGRLYHHLAILARPNRLEQLGLYAKSLTTVDPFMNTRESIRTLFESASKVRKNGDELICTHASLFDRNYEQAQLDMSSFISSLNEGGNNIGAQWQDSGALIAIANISALFDYGTNDALKHYFKLYNHLAGLSTAHDAELDDVPDELKDPSLFDACNSEAMVQGSRLLAQTLATAFENIEYRNVLPHIHVVLVFVVTLAGARAQSSKVHDLYASSSVQPRIVFDQLDWEKLCTYLSNLLQLETLTTQLEQFDPWLGNSVTPLPEDFLLRGSVWAETYFPEKWFESFSNANELTELRTTPASVLRARVGRVLYLGYKLANFGYIDYDGQKFTHIAISHTPIQTGLGAQYKEIETLLKSKADSGTSRIGPVVSWGNSSSASGFSLAHASSCSSC